MNDPDLFSVGGDDLAAAPGDDDSDLGLLSPAERLSEGFPNEFATYCEHFVDYFPRVPYYVKTTYDPSSQYAGWPQRKSRRTKRPLALIDSKAWLNRIDTVERHLDYSRTAGPRSKGHPWRPDSDLSRWCQPAWPGRNVYGGWEEVPGRTGVRPHVTNLVMWPDQVRGREDLDTATPLFLKPHNRRPW